MNYSMILVAIIAICASCGKKEDVALCNAGMGGAITLKVSVAHRGLAPHHSTVVRPYTIWIAYNTKDIPKARYDFNQTVDSTKSSTEISGLKCGDYYVFMNGRDTAVNEFLIGGTALSIPKETTGEVSLVVSLTER